jgi:hypothetical protein
MWYDTLDRAAVHVLEAMLIYKTLSKFGVGQGLEADSYEHCNEVSVSVSGRQFLQ